MGKARSPRRETQTERELRGEGGPAGDQPIGEALAALDLLVLEFGADGRLTFCNDYYLAFTGWSRGEVIGRDWSDLFSVQGQPGGTAQPLCESGRLKTDIPYRSRAAIATAGGQERLASWNNLVCHDAFNNPISVTCIGRDHADSKQIADYLEENERKYRATLNCMADAIHVMDPDFRVVLFNERFHQWSRELGLDEPLVRRNLFEVFPFLPSTVRDEYLRVFSTGLPLTSEERQLVKGREVVTETRKIPIVEHGKVVRVLTSVHDVTERRQAERALRESEEKYRNILDSIQEGYYEVDLEGNFTFFNKGLCRILGYSADETKGMNYRQYYGDEETITKVYRAFNEVFRTGRAVRMFDWWVLRKDGSRAILGVSISLMRDANGKPIGFRGMANDVTESKQNEKALRDAEARNRALLNAIPDNMIHIRRDGTILDFRLDSDTPESLWSRDQVVGTQVDHLVPEELASRIRRHVARTLDTGRLETFEFQMVADDVVRDYEARLVVCGEDEVLAIVRDITERKRTEQQLRESEHRYRELFENAHDMVYTHDLNGYFTSVNKAGEQTMGYTREEATHVNAIDLVVPEQRAFAQQMVARKLAGEDPTQYELSIVAKDGHIVPIEVSTRLILKNGKPVGIQGIARDITERKRGEEERRQLEAQIQHAQKLEGLGVLAGGIAHDFNNLLVGILGYADLALNCLPVESPARAYVENVEASAQRAAGLTNQMLAYSGKGAFVIQALDLSRLAQEMGHLLGAAISKKVILKYDCAPGLPNVRGDAAQLQQVIMNLITNASDAIGDEAGVITLRTERGYADRAYLSRTFLDDDLRPGWYVSLEVSDTGCGMPPETQARIFDPFFTTKFAGRGLGLAAVLGIVRGHKGAIKVYSEPRQGTTIKILLPAMEMEDVTQRAVSETAGHDQELAGWRADGTVLIADDEPSARDVAREALERRGFKVLTAADGKEAVELFLAHSEDIVAVLLDLTMPVMSGEEAFQRIYGIRSDVPVILSSGYTEQDATSRFTGRAPAGFLQKPYVLSALVRELRRVLAP